MINVNIILFGNFYCTCCFIVSIIRACAGVCVCVWRGVYKRLSRLYAFLVLCFVFSVRNITLLVAMCLSVFVGIEGFTLSEEFIVKELTLLYENGEFDHMLFSPPLHENYGASDLRTIIYITANVHGIPYRDGTMPYASLNEVLSNLQKFKVFCYGENTRQLLQNYLPFTSVVNITHKGFAMPQVLPKVWCGRNHVGRHCSMSKAMAVQSFCVWNHQDYEAEKTKK